jgi:hypothetical protein
MRLTAALLAAALPATAQDTPPFATFDKASEAVLNDAHDLAFGPDGRLYVADKLGARIVVFDPETLEVLEVLGEGALPQVRDISFGPQGQAVVAVTGVSAVAVWADPSRIGSQPDLVLSAPSTEGVLAHSNGRIYAAAAPERFSPTTASSWSPSRRASPASTTSRRRRMAPCGWPTPATAGWYSTMPISPSSPSSTRLASAFSVRATCRSPTTACSPSPTRTPTASC